MKRLIIIYLSLWCTENAMSQSPFFQNLPLGEHPVGFKTLFVKDSSRLYGSGHRPLLISLWYPAAHRQGKSLRFEEYIFNTAKQLKLSQSGSTNSKARSNFMTRMAQRGASLASLDSLLRTKTDATLQSPHTQEIYPLIISLQGGGRPAYTQFILNEYLASYGYVVAAISDIRSHPDRTMTTAKSNAEALAMDIDLVKGQMRQITNGQLGLMGFSKAGEAILLHQLLETPAQAQVLMDAQPGKETLNFLDPGDLLTINIPTLAFFSNHQGRMNISEAQKDTVAFSNLGGNVLKFRLMEANHGDLTSAAVIGDIVPNYNRWPSFGNSRLSYETLCKLTLLFLNHYLKDTPGEEKVTSLINTLPDGFLVMHQIRK